MGWWAEVKSFLASILTIIAIIIIVVCLIIIWIYNPPAGLAATAIIFNLTVYELLLIGILCGVVAAFLDQDAAKRVWATAGKGLGEAIGIVLGTVLATAGGMVSGLGIWGLAAAAIGVYLLVKNKSGQTDVRVVAERGAP